MGSEGDTDADENQVDDSPLTCRNCGAAIDRTDWHPVRTWTDADGGFHMDAFCSMDCRAEHTLE